MGRSYWFECSKCGYRAKVSGRADRGVYFAVQTILCQDCKTLHDAIVRVKVPAEDRLNRWRVGSSWRIPPRTRAAFAQRPPTLEEVLSQLPREGATRHQWLRFKPQCPVASAHKVRVWDEPDRCPKCGMLMEKHALPYRLWD